MDDLEQAILAGRRPSRLLGGVCLLLRSLLLSLVASSYSTSAPFLCNKLTQLLALLVRLDYPHVYPSYFLDLLLPSPPQPAPTNMFVRVLIFLDI
jgi:exportin-T